MGFVGQGGGTGAQGKALDVRAIPALHGTEPPAYLWRRKPRGEASPLLLQQEEFHPWGVSSAQVRQPTHGYSGPAPYACPRGMHRANPCTGATHVPDRLPHCFPCPPTCLKPCHSRGSSALLPGPGHSGGLSLCQAQGCQGAGYTRLQLRGQPAWPQVTQDEGWLTQC